MNFSQETLKDLLFTKKFNNLSSILDCLQGVLQCNIQNIESISSDLISPDFFEEIISFTASDYVSLYFGKSMRDLKCVLKTEDYKEHEIFFLYKGPKQLLVTSVSLPYSPLQDRDYSSLEDLVSTFRHHVNGLAGYFRELENIDKCCTIMEPNSPTFKEDYRRILLDDRTWLHLEVTPDGLATNIHLIGQSEYWQNKLQEGLLKWDHDMDIVRNIMHIFDIGEFPKHTRELGAGPVSAEAPAERPVCSICLCDELPDIPGVPLPLCQNPTCGIYFHRACLFQWLVACSGGRPPAFGVATGSCPTCLQPIACNENDS